METFTVLDRESGRTIPGRDQAWIDRAKKNGRGVARFGEFAGQPRFVRVEGGEPTAADLRLESAKKKGQSQSAQPAEAVNHEAIKQHIAAATTLEYVNRIEHKLKAQNVYEQYADRLEAKRADIAAAIKAQNAVPAPKADAPIKSTAPKKEANMTAPGPKATKTEAKPSKPKPRK